ncbi:MAG TPA: glucose-6-phosphate isomerase [Anaerolineales bacterium]|nr:glucose-6-phosphate isomerase [Anaerolineales bacterium]
MSNIPLSIDLKMPGFRLSHYDKHIRRSLASMKGQFADEAAFQGMLAQEDALLYDVYEFHRPEIAGELLSGISIIHPGRVGSEYYMTKGHFHSVLDTAEVYYTLEGQGCMVMETPEGDWSIEELCAGRILYVPPRWAHRSVNTGTGDLVMLFVYPANAGHDYGAIERQGFRKLILEVDGKPQIVDNPRWKSPGDRK